MGRARKIERRLNRWIEVANNDEAFCKKHECYLTGIQIIDKHCYNGNHGKNGCKYLTEMSDKERKEK